MVESVSTRNFKTLHQPVEEYLETLNEQDKKNFLTALLKYCVPAFGFEPPASSRMNTLEKNRLLEVLKDIPFKSINDLLDKQSKYLEEIDLNKNSRYPLVSRIKKFVDTYQSTEPGENKEKKFHRSRSKYSCNNLKLTGRKYDNTFELKEYPKSLDIELDLFKNFAKQKLDVQSSQTIKTYTSHIKQYLGWLIYNQKLDFENISLNAVVPLVKLYNFNLNSDRKITERRLRDYAYKKMMVESKCQEVSQITINQYSEFLASREITPRSKEGFYTAMICLAKFIYKDETNLFLSENFNDVPLLVLFRKVRKDIIKDRKIYAKSHNQNIDNKLISWERVLEIVEHYRLRYETKDYRKPDRHKVKPFTTACDLQKFLMLSFFTVMPPDRRRTFVELTYGKSLKHGLYDEYETFTPVEKLKDKRKAKYYIYLSDGDYKTWKSYGTWIAEIPNKKYKNGKSFYDYINEWLFCGYEKGNKKIGYRYIINEKPSTERFFMTQKGTEMTGCNFSAIVRNCFYRECGKAVTPHTLRHIYISHINKLGYDDATLGSVAYWMKHSSEVAKKVYSHLKQHEKLDRACKAMEKVKHLHNQYLT